ncbi:MAG TPA: Hsp20/alpha crystallin family protein [Acidobacteriota bacterium]|nr:Hsp20/alpha crystallin family protein [Acidobacteriota bacterium]
MTEKTAALTTEKRDLDTGGEKTLATRDDTLYIAPPVDIFETDDALTVVADLPGVEKDVVDIRVEDGILTIKGRANYRPQAEMLRQEFSLQGYYRQFKLSDEVDQERISAECKNGVLTITLPKAEKSKPRQIKVKMS